MFNKTEQALQDFWERPEVLQHHEEFEELISPLDDQTRKRIIEMDTEFHVFIQDEGSDNQVITIQ